MKKNNFPTAATFRKRSSIKKRLLLLAFLSLPACSIHTPEMKFTGGKTALENQILGTYNQVREDVWMVASVRAASPDSQITLSEEKRAVLTAMQNRDFNKDDIDEFKREGLVGENAKGLLEIRPHAKLEAEATFRKLVEDIVAEENRDRQIIMQRVIDINPSIQAAEATEVEKVFAKLNRDNAKAGDWVQTLEGEWVKKK